MTTQEAIKYIFEFLEASDLQAPASEVFKAGIAIGTIQRAIETKEKEIKEKRQVNGSAREPRREPGKEVTKKYMNALSVGLGLFLMESILRIVRNVGVT